ncbi:MAG TPA: SDR family NAD(P)-dependent oxidoreductase [Steroidobacteraceae bacterium]|nr:SDR family NAD(P)-dependent oxidoreductase [Steroidobacteraceae bacterium]
MHFINRRQLLTGLAAAVVSDSFAQTSNQKSTQTSNRTPRSQFGATSTAEDVTKGLDLSGKTVIVTGCNSGLGLESMRVLALRGAHVIGTARTLEKGREACASVKGQTTPVALELTDFASVVECAKQIGKLTPNIDILMLNAGIASDKFEQINGLEQHFVVNHLGHFVLTHHLIDLVRAAPQGRVVVVGSGSHLQAPAGGIQFNNLKGNGWEDKAYAHSKLANGLFSLELSRRLAGSRATSNCLTPGPVHTNIFSNWATKVEREAKTPPQGAATQCYVATAPQLARVTGEYFKDCNPMSQSSDQRDAKMAAKLWETSTQLTRAYLA